MLALSPFRNPNNETENQTENSPMVGYDQFPDLSAGNDLIDTIDFDDLFAGIDDDADMLPDIDMDPEILAQFSLAVGHDFDPPNISSPKSDTSTNNNQSEKEAPAPSVSGSGSDLASAQSSSSPIETEPATVTGRNNPTPKDKGRKSTATSKNPPGKKKVKVDWTPELHRRFVQAVEQLGLDKAVPSRILEVMGIDCLTRHHIASHLQKYRSHRKHLLAREAEAASWGRRRQAYGGGAGGDVSPWIAPTIGFPPVAVAPPPVHHVRPLHVWGHPSVDQSLVHTWQTPPPQAWPPPPPPPSDPSFWIPHHHHVPSPGTPCFPHLAPAVPAAGVPPPVVVGQGQEPPRPPAVVHHPSKECVDAAIGDALSKPWLPLPLGLKPPSVGGVMVELQRQGVSKVPPTC